MTITKLAHSCIRVEKDSTTVLFDPGSFSPPELGTPDAVLLTHSHGDHCDVERVRALADAGALVFAPQELTLALIKAGIRAKALRAHSVFTVGGLSFQVLDGAHEPLPVTVPANAPVLVDGRFLHPGDSLHVAAPEGLELLALPYAAPWCTLNDAVAFAERLRPAQVLPIHDGMYVPSFRAGQTANLAKALEQRGIATVGDAVVLEPTT